MRSVAIRSALAAALAVPALTLQAPADAAPPRTTVTTEAYVAGQPVPLLKHVDAGWDGSMLTATADVTYPGVESRVRGTWEGTVKVGRDGHLMSLRRELTYNAAQPLAPSVGTGFVIEYRWRNSWRRADRVEESFLSELGSVPAQSEQHDVRASVSRLLAGRSVPVRVTSTASYAGGIADLTDELDVLPPGPGMAVIVAPSG